MTNADNSSHLPITDAFSQAVEAAGKDMNELSRFLKDTESFLSAATSSANELYCKAQSMRIVKDVEQGAYYEFSMTNNWPDNDELYIAISSTLDSEISYKLRLTTPNDAYLVGAEYYSPSSDKWEKRE